MESKLLEKLNNPANLLICVDLDGTLCSGEFWGVGEPEPLQKIIDLVSKWYMQGAHIIIFTARQEKYYPETKAWLVKYRVPHHGIAMRTKPGADLYIDDKAINVSSLI